MCVFALHINIKGWFDCFQIKNIFTNTYKDFIYSMLFNEQLLNLCCVPYNWSLLKKFASIKGFQASEANANEKKKNVYF